MSFKDAFRFDYDFVHQQIQEIIDKFDENLAFVRPSPDMNHAAWLLGHITWCEDFLIADVPYGKTYRKKEWDVLFMFGSKILDRIKYAPYSEIRKHYHNVHEQVLRHFKILSEESLGVLVPYNDGHYSRMSFLLHFIEEGSTHVGQLQYLYKFLLLKTDQRNAVDHK